MTQLRSKSRVSTPHVQSALLTLTWRREVFVQLIELASDELLRVPPVMTAVSDALFSEPSRQSPFLRLCGRRDGAELFRHGVVSVGPLNGGGRSAGLVPTVPGEMLSVSELVPHNWAAGNFIVHTWISILYTDWFYAFGRLSKKGQNLFSILVTSLQVTELNIFIITFY